MDGLHVEVVSSRPRFKTAAELHAAKQPTEDDLKNRALKLRTDVNAALRRIDKALGHHTPYYTPPHDTGHTAAEYRP